MRDLRPFALERYLDRFELSVAHLLCASDVEPLSLPELLAHADGELRERWDALHLGYTPAAGDPLLRADIASFHSNVTPDDVLVCAPIEGLFLFFNAALRTGDHVIAVWPAYGALHEVARAAGAEVTRLPLRAEDGFRFDVGALRRAMRPSTRAIVVNFPHNPTGALPTRDEFEQIVEIARDAGAILFSDEMYRFLEPEEALRLPSAVERYDRGVVLGGLSKTFGLPGLRLGWLVCRDAPLRARLRELRDYTTLCSPAPSELLGRIALSAREALWSRARALVAANTAAFEAFVRRWNDVLDWVPPRAGSVAFPSLRRGDADAFAEELVAREGALVLAGSKFDLPGPYFRVGLGRRGFMEGLARVDAFLSRTR